MSKLPDPVPINAFFSADDTFPNPEMESDVRAWLEDADLIFGTDVMSGQEFIVYGRDLIQRIAGGAPEGEEVRILNVAIDQDSEDLKRLIDLVTTVKGRHDYIAFGESKPPATDDGA